jgi:hypothetical protein
MHKIGDFLKKHTKSGSTDASTAAPVHLPEGFPSKQDIFRYRKQRGVNLGTSLSREDTAPSAHSHASVGSWFVLEKWIAGSPFRETQGSSDLDVARGPNARAILEQHWDTWITEQDFAYIASKGINTVRLPVRLVSGSGCLACSHRYRSGSTTFAAQMLPSFRAPISPTSGLFFRALGQELRMRSHSRTSTTSVS